MERDGIEACSWAKKVELPTLDGSGPEGWIVRAEKFLASEKTQLALIGMEGNVVHWFRFLCKKTPDMNWEGSLQC